MSLRCLIFLVVIGLVNSIPLDKACLNNEHKSTSELAELLIKNINSPVNQIIAVVEEISNQVEKNVQIKPNHQQEVRALADCSQMDQGIVDEIKNYQPIADAIIDYAMNGEHKDVTYYALQHFLDTFGPRIVSSS